MSSTFIAEPEDILYTNIFYPKQIESSYSSGNDAFLCTEDTEAAETRNTSKIVTHTHWETRLSGQMLQIVIPFNTSHLQNKTVFFLYCC